MSNITIKHNKNTTIFTESVDGKEVSEELYLTQTIDNENEYISIYAPYYIVKNDKKTKKVEILKITAMASDTGERIPEKDYAAVNKDLGALNKVANKEPGLVQKALNFSKATAKHISSGGGILPKELIDKRFEICSTCPEFINKTEYEVKNEDGTTETHIRGKCAKCGCSLFAGSARVSKLAWPTSECPIGKWGKEELPKENTKENTEENN